MPGALRLKPVALSDLTGAVMDGAVLTGTMFDRVTGWPPG
jgi:hypothetical protein